MISRSVSVEAKHQILMLEGLADAHRHPDGAQQAERRRVGRAEEERPQDLLSAMEEEHLDGLALAVARRLIRMPVRSLVGGRPHQRDQRMVNNQLKRDRLG